MTALIARMASPLERPDPTTRSVVDALLAGHRYGLEIARTCHLKPSTVYPVLARLEEYGWVAAEWQDPGEQARRVAPRRRLYRLTPSGSDLARRLNGTDGANRSRPLEQLASHRNRRYPS